VAGVGQLLDVKRKKKNETVNNEATNDFQASDEGDAFLVMLTTVKDET
jgi:hypothetical protein